MRSGVGTRDRSSSTGTIRCARTTARAEVEGSIDGDAVRLVRLVGDVCTMRDPDAPAPAVSVVFVEQGSGAVEVGGTERPLAAGTLCVSEGDIGVRGIALRGWLLGIERGADMDVAPGAYAVGGSFGARCEAFFEALADELSLGRAGNGGAVRSLVQLIVLTCTRAVGSLPAWPAGPSASTQRLAEHVLEVIDRRFAERLSLADVAIELSRSPASIARAAREVTGRSVLELIADRRLREARSLLADSELPVSEIASLVGYPTLGYFHRVFRRECGTTPQRWRESQRVRSR